MLIVPIHCHVARTYLESRRTALSLKPFEALFPNSREALGGPISSFSGTQRVHHHIMLDGTAAGGVTAANHRIGAQRKPEPIPGFPIPA